MLAPMTRSLVIAFAGLAACGGDDGVGSLPDGPNPPDARMNDAPMLDAPPACVPPSGTGTMHGGSVTAAETWTADASPHILPFDLSINAAVTIEPCAVVRIAVKKTVTIGPGGALIAAGAPGLPVTIDALDAGMPWATIRALGGDLSLTHTIVRGGGDPLNTLPQLTGALQMQVTGATGTLHVEDVEIADSLSTGVYITGTVGFDATSTNLRIHGAASFPVHTFARMIGTVPSGVYTGNERDAIAIAGNGGPVLTTQTLRDRGVPYHVGSGTDGGRMDVTSQTSGSVAVLTIEAGVTMQFPPGGTLNIEPANGTAPARGALIAIGTAAKPIVLTSDVAVPAAGDWLGLGFGGQVDPQSVVQHVRVEFAGGPGTGSNSCPYAGRVGQNDAAIRIFGPPQTQFITDTEIVASARDGIDRGWRADLAPDFLPSNTFTAVPGCKQSLPRTAAGVCPVTPACP